MENNNLNLDTYCKNTWCPGCGDFGILQALKQAITFFDDKGIPKDNIVLTTGIGCHAKIVDYLDLNTFYSLHGRAVAVAEGIKLGNPDLKVITSSGDGDSYNEGISHLIHAAKRNIDITVLIHDNRIFALTTGQFTATSPKGLKGRSTPEGSIEEPFNPLKLMLCSNATFIARGYSAKIEHLKKLIVEAVEHKGFSFVEILQPCVSFFNSYQFYNEKVYEMESNDLDSSQAALKKIEEWNYNGGDAKVPIGVFYKVQKPAYDQALLEELNPSKRDRKVNLEKVLDVHI